MSRAVLFALLVLGAASHAPGQEGAPSGGGQCNIDTVFGNLATGGYLAASGFAFDSEHGAPVRKVELILDGVAPGEVSLRGLRPDVLAHFARQDYLWSGWNGKVSLEGVRPGVHSVDVVATLESGKAISCGHRTFSVVAVAEVVDRAPRRIAAEILLRTALFLFWLTLVGWAPARILRVPAASAPFVGLALFAVFAEAGDALHLRPSRVAGVLTILSIAALAVFLVKRHVRVRRASRGALATAGCVLLFALIGVIPLASHGEGAVLGDIDDATRECVVADSLSRYGWSVPSEVTGYFSSMRAEVEKRHIRRGGSYLLSALADAFGDRAHAVHSVAMLSAGCLVVWGAGLLARVVARKRRAARSWIAAALVAVNSTVVATLYGQHLGSLMAAALLLPLLAFLLRLAWRPAPRGAAALGLMLAAGLVLYPEGLAVSVVSLPFALLATAGGRRRGQVVLLSGAALLIAAVLAPTALARFARFSSGEASRFSTAMERVKTGDTHYFPSPAVIWGLDAYREDAPAPLGPVRAVLVPVVAILIGAAALLGWLRLSRRERGVILTLIVPAALALGASLRLNFPYGYAKFLPIAAAVWSVAFAQIAGRLLSDPARDSGSLARRVLAAAALGLALVMALPSVRHVVRRAVRSIPAYDSAYRVLPALGRTAGRGADIVVDEPVVASREWIRYFLGDDAVFDRSSLPPGEEGSRRYLLVDRRRAAAVTLPRGVSSRTFLLAPAPPERSGR